MAQPAFWDSPDLAQKVVQENKLIQQRLDLWSELTEQYEELEVLLELAQEGETSALPEFGKLLDAFQKHLEDVEFQQMLSGPHARSNAILSINAGAGGTES